MRSFPARDVPAEVLLLLAAMRMFPAREPSIEVVLLLAARRATPVRAPAATTRCDELELQQEFYGEDWRKYSQRYEIGLAGTAVSDAGGAARGGTILDSFTKDEYCDVDEPTAACVARAGAADFILLGKVPAQGACPEEGVAQLINDHTALKMSGACVEIDQ